MIIQNTAKNVFLILAVMTTFISCSSTKVSEQSSSFATKTKNIQEAGKQAQSGYSTAQKYSEQYKTATNHQQKSGSGNAASPTNFPPSQNINELPNTGSWLDRTFGKVIYIYVTVENGANQNFPIVFDLVFVKDPDTYVSLTTISTRDWFRIDEQATEALKKQHNLLEIQELTAIPESKNYHFLVRVPAHIKAGLFFVRLVGNDNLYPQAFNPYKDITLDFTSNNFELIQNK